MQRGKKTLITRIDADQIMVKSIVLSGGDRTEERLTEYKMFMIIISLSQLIRDN